MKRLMWSAILAVAVLAVGTIAQAAVVDVTLNFSKTEGIAVGETIDWSLTIEAKDNTYTASGGPTVALGVQTGVVGLNSSVAGIVEIPEGIWAAGPKTGQPTGAPATGSVVANTAAEPGGFGTPPLPVTYQYSAGRGLEDILLSGRLIDPDVDYDGWNGTFTDVEEALKRGSEGNAVVFMSGQMTALAEGQVTYTPKVNIVNDMANVVIYRMDEASWALSQSSATEAELNIIGQTLTVGGGSNEVPTVAIPGGNVLEGDWTGDGPWNNLARSVTITAEGDDPDGENGDLTYEWTMMAPGGADKVLSETGAVLNLTLAEIESLGLPAWQGPGDDPSYHWTLSVTANDGTDTSTAAQIDVFVPEPTTMGLLGFGVLALLKRRRRA